MSRDGGSGYRIYVFEESIRRYAIDCKGQGRKYTKARGSPIKAPTVGFCQGYYCSHLGKPSGQPSDTPQMVASHVPKACARSI